MCVFVCDMGVTYEASCSYFLCNTWYNTFRLYVVNICTLHPGSVQVCTPEVCRCVCTVYSRSVQVCVCTVYSRSVQECVCTVYSRSVQVCVCTVYSRSVQVCVCTVYSRSVYRYVCTLQKCVQVCVYSILQQCVQVCAYTPAVCTGVCIFFICVHEMCSYTCRYR